MKNIINKVCCAFIYIFMLATAGVILGASIGIYQNVCALNPLPEYRMELVSPASVPDLVKDKIYATVPSETPEAVAFGEHGEYIVSKQQPRDIMADKPIVTVTDTKVSSDTPPVEEQLPYFDFTLNEVSSDYNERLKQVRDTYYTSEGIYLGEPVEYFGEKYITGYDCCYDCCGKNPGDRGYGLTASGTYVMEGRTCACNDLPFGTVIYISRLGFYVVEDRGGMSNGNIDVYCNTHDTCYAITGNYQVYVMYRPE